MSSNDPTTERSEPVGEPARIAQVLRLFREELADVQFPGVSAAILDAHAAELGERRTAVEAARAALREAERELDLAQEVLGQLVERGIAYAKIYAVGNPALEGALGTVDPTRVPRTKARSAARKEGRPRPAPAAEPSAQAVLPAPRAAVSAPRAERLPAASP